jgi:hypothetical protein
MRERIFHTALQTSQQSYEFWSKTYTRLQYSMEPPSHVVDDMKTGLAKFLRFRLISLALADIRMKCSLCLNPISDNEAARHTSSSLDQPGHLLDSDDNGDNGDDAHQIPIAPRPSRRSLPEIQLPEVESEESPMNLGEDPFDDYESALLVSSEDQDVIPNTWAFDRYGMLVLDKHWSIWRDRGYRLEPGFFSMFSQKEPLLLNDHLLPYLNPNDTVYPPSPSSPAPHPSPSPSDLRSTDIALDPPDLTRMGAQEMLDEAGSVEGRSESQNVFVKGNARDGNHIYFDLERDAVDLSDDDVSVSVDIDSVIWVTNKPQFKGHIHLHLLPLLGDKPPFSVNNHVYVQVLQPPSEIDREARQKSQRSKRYPLSALPHTHFAQTGQGSSQFNTYVFFPRMIRRDPNTRRMTTLIPREVQELWFSHVVIPAVQKLLANYHGLAEYIPTSIDDLRRKMGERRGTKTIPLTPDVFSTMRTTLHDIINDHPNLLDRFGSFFFVVDARGIKVLSKQCHQSENVYTALCSMISDIDWDYMSERSHGELLLDLGISYHPPSGQEPLVGLWRLANIDDSYDLMGMKKGTTHHTAMFAHYGGRQAETKLIRSQLIHLCFRSSYNLCFEVIRHPRQTNYLCNDGDAVKINDQFVTGCDNWKKLFQSSQNRSFGVREEVRGSGMAIVKLLDLASEKVCSKTPIRRSKPLTRVV